MFNKEKLMAMGLTEEQADKIMATINDEYRPAFKFNERGDEIDRLKKELDKKDETIDTREKQINDIKKELKDNEELQNTITELEKANELEKEQHQQELAEYKFNTGLEKKLKEDFGAKNVKAVKALLNLDKVKQDGDDYIGLKEQVDPLLKTDDYLFDVEDDGKGGLKGRKVKIKDNDNQTFDENPFKTGSVNLTKQYEVLSQDPALAKSFIEKAGLNPADYDL